MTGVVESRVRGTTIEVFTGETSTVSIAAIDATGAAVDLSGKTLEIVIEATSGTDKATIEDASITVVGSSFSFAIPSAVSSSEGSYRWALRQASDDGVLMQGALVVTYAATGD